MGVIPLSDASRRPTRMPAVTASLIAVNAVVFLLELLRGETFITSWSLVPADIVAGRHLFTILSSMFMHGSFSHILGNMVFLWAFGPEIEDLMGRGRYLVFYLLGGLAATFAQVAADPTSTISNLGASGAIAAVMGQDPVAARHFRVRPHRLHPRRAPRRRVVPDAARQPRCRRPEPAALGRRGVRRACRRIHLRGRDGTPVRGTATPTGSRNALT